MSAQQKIQSDTKKPHLLKLAVIVVFDNFTDVSISRGKKMRDWGTKSALKQQKTV